jgi:hypothetical protein
VYSLPQKYWLIDAENPITQCIYFKTKKFFEAIQFNIRIDRLTNAGAKAGDLSPQHAMYWTWQSGYINLKIEDVSILCQSLKQHF